jgi:hypothetical protein
VRVLAFIALALCCLSSNADGAGANQVGYIGCSNTRDSVTGYHKVVGNLNKFWPAYDTGSGAIQFWAQPTSNHYWGGYLNNIFAYGQPLIVWAQLCENVSSYAPTDYPHVQAMLTNLHHLSPSAIVYVSAINAYDPPLMCADMGTDGRGYADTVTWRDQAVMDGLASLGPAMGPLTQALTVSDRCHANPAGMQLLGNQLKGFFDGF